MATNNNTKKEDIFKKYGLDSLLTKDKNDLKESVLTLKEMASDDDISDDLIDILVKRKHKNQTYELSEAKGVTGTRISNGHIRIDPSTQPYVLRGLMSRPGLLDEMALEPNAFRGVNEIRNLMVGSKWGVSSFDEDQAQDPNQDQDQDHKEHTQWLASKLKDVKVGDMGQRGLTSFIEQACSSLIAGFAIFEIVYDTDEETGWKYPSQILFREQSTLDEWVIDLEEDELAAVRFQSGDDTFSRYELSAGGPALEDHQVLLISLNRRGKNYEGISPLRPAKHWIPLKILLSRISAAAADLQGVPVRYVRNAFEALKDDSEHADDRQLEEVTDDLALIEEGEASIIQLPNGVEVGVLDSEGTLIDVQPIIEYCDRMIALCFSTEGSLLGQSKVGSYALAETSDKQFLSQIPYYVKQITQPVNDLIRKLTIANIGPSMPAQTPYATLDMEFGVTRNSTQWIKDLIDLMEAKIWTWPQPLKESALEELGLPTDLFDDWNPSFIDKVPIKDNDRTIEEEQD